jgi:hypothetical protein
MPYTLITGVHMSANGGHMYLIVLDSSPCLSDYQSSSLSIMLDVDVKTAYLSILVRDAVDLVL